MFSHLLVREENIYKCNPDLINLNQWDVDYIVQTIWHHRSPVSGLSLSVRGMDLVRWDRNKPSDISNLVLMTKDEANKHEKIKSVNEYDENVVFYYYFYREKILKKD